MQIECLHLVRERRVTCASRARPRPAPTSTPAQLLTRDHDSVVHEARINHYLILIPQLKVALVCYM